MKLFKRKAILPVIILLSFVVSINCFAQEKESSEPESIEIGKKYKFHSQVLDEDREIWVRVPDGYEHGSTSYPVVYLLDGADHFIFVSGLLRRFERRSMPKSILVGVNNTDRTRDMTPPTQNEKEKEQSPSAGGADNFTKMFAEDLIPYINENFRAKDFKTLIGHSFGGLYITRLLTTNPDLFNAYLSISPSLWWNDQKVVTSFEEQLKVNPEMKALIYMTMGNERGDMLGGMMKMVGVLETEQPKNIRWDYKVHPAETHSTNPDISELEAFEFFYKDWFVPNPYEEYMSAGMESFALRSKRIKQEFDEDWELPRNRYGVILNEMYENKMFKEELELGLQLLAKDKIGVRFYQAVAQAYLGLGDGENAGKYYAEAYKMAPGNEQVIKMIDSLGVDNSKLLAPAKLKKKDYEKYIGEYVINQSTLATVHYSDNDSLMMVISSMKTTPFTLLSMGEDKFYVDSQGFTFDFVFEDANNNIAAHIAYMNDYGDIELFLRKNNNE